MTITTLILPQPPSSNRYWRVGRNSVVYRSSEATDYINTIRAYVLSMGGVSLLYGDLTASMIWLRERKSGDLDNRKKILFDALQGITYPNDKQIAEEHTRRVDYGNPRKPQDGFACPPASGKVGLVILAVHSFQIDPPPLKELQSRLFLHVRNEVT